MHCSAKKPITKFTVIPSEGTRIHSVSRMQSFSQTITVRPGDPLTVSSFLAKFTRLSKRRIKEAMVKGAVWYHRPGIKKHRLRRATGGLQAGV
jgi:hypothetical protein